MTQVDDDRLDPNNINLIDLPDRWGHTITPGMLVQICDGTHPHFDRVGTYRGVNVLVAGMAGAKIELNNGDGCYIFKAHQWQRFGQEPPRKRRRR